MARYSNTVLNEFEPAIGQPISGAKVYVYQSTDEDRSLASLTDDDSDPLDNPVTTDDYGAFYFNADDGLYDLEYWAGGKKRWTDQRVQVGVGPELPAEIVASLAVPGMAATVGSTGPSNVQADLNARPTSATLAASSGSSLVGTIATGAGAASRSVQSKLRETVAVTDFGAAANDGATNATAAFEAARVATAAQTADQSGTLHMSVGTYRLAGGFGAPGLWRLTGDSPYGPTLINNSGDSSRAFLTSAEYAYGVFDNFKIENFASLLRFTGQTETINVASVQVENHSGYALDFANHFFVSTIEKSIFQAFSAGGGGIRVLGNANANLSLSNDYANLTLPVFRLNHSEGFLSVNDRVEGDNRAGQASYSLAQASHQHLCIFGGYTEGAHEYIVAGYDGSGNLSTFAGTGLVAFIGRHFTFYTSGVQHKWSTTVPLPIMACDFAIATRLPPTAQPIGFNQNLIRSEYVSHTPFVSKRRRPPSVSGGGPWVHDMLTVSRPSAANDPDNMGVLTGTLRYTGTWGTSGGTNKGQVAAEYRIVVTADAANNMAITVTEVARANTGNGSATLAIAASGSASTTQVVLIGTWTGINPTSIDHFDHGYRIDWNQSSGLAANTFAVSEPGV